MFKRILVPLDGSPAAEAALEPAMYLSSLDGGEIVLCRVQVLPADLGYIVEYPIPNYTFEEEHNRCDTYLMSVAGRMREAGRTVDYKVLDNTKGAAEQIVDTASELHCDLIVLTSHGRSGVTRFMLGSVAENVARLASCPVMIVGRHTAILDDAKEKAAAHASP